MVAKVDPHRLEQSAKTNGAHQAATLVPTKSAVEADPFYYGWRTEWTIGPDGKPVSKDIPLPQEAFLDPQEGDHFVQSDKHNALVASLFARFDKRYMNDDTIGVYSDMKFEWGIPGLQEPAPDLAIVRNLHTKDVYHGSFKVVEEGTRPCLVVEVTSPNYPFDDNKKVAIYEQAGVPEYIIVNPHYDQDDHPFELTGYRLVDGVYIPMQPDEAGRFYSATADVWFGLTEDERALVVEDGATGQPLLDNRNEYAARRRAEEQHERALQRAEAEAQRAEVEAQRADREAQARTEAEERAAAAEAELARLRAMWLTDQGKST